MKKYLPLFLCFSFLINLHAQAQYSRYIIKLKDKGSNPFTLANPIQYLSQQAIDRRTKYNIAIDSTDLPVTPRYVDSIRLAGAVVILNTSKWLNQVAIQTTDAAALAKINAFPFVISAAPIASLTSNQNPVKKQLDAPVIMSGNTPPTSSNSFIDAVGVYNYGKSGGQVKLHNGDFLHNHGFRGEGMKMTILDAGFYHYLTLPTFDSLRTNNQILGTWDFVKNEVSVNEDDPHGMQCLSTIGANIPGTFVGTAPKASFYLYRTEDVASEYPIEEQNWAAGIERADSLGIPVSSTSLGYFQFDDPAFNYTYADMNGNKTISAKAADFAAKKGMLLVIAAGNTGTDAWHYLITPSDADSVLSVGAVDSTGIVAGFTAYGPSSDGQIKPSVAAVGLNAYVANTGNGLPTLGNGTSFACPNMAGLVTCLWQAFPEVNNMSIIDVLQKSATKATAPDNRIGYGIPDMKKSFVLLIKKLATKQASISKCTVDLNFSVKSASWMSIVLERKATNETVYSTVQTFSPATPFMQNNFSYTDDIAQKSLGAVTYRIKMTIDADTTFYVDSMVVNYTQTCLPTQDKITIGPNPVLQNLTLNIERLTAAKIDILVSNALGQKVYAKTIQQPSGFATETVNMAALPKGVYFVTIFTNGKKTSVTQILR